MLRPAGFFESFRPWRRQLGPVSSYFKRTSTALTIPLTVAIIQGPGYSLADPTTATSPQSDQLTVFTVTFSGALSTHAGAPDTSSWVVTNGTLVSAVYSGTYHPFTPAAYLVTIHATTVGDVTLNVPAASNISLYGTANTISNTETVTFTPDAPVGIRKWYWVNVTSGPPVAPPPITSATVAQATSFVILTYWEPRVDLDPSTIASVTSADATVTSSPSSPATYGSVSQTGPSFLFPSGPTGLLLECSGLGSGTPTYTVNTSIRSGAAGSPLRSVFGDLYDATAAVGITIVP